MTRRQFVSSNRCRRRRRSRPPPSSSFPTQRLRGVTTRRARAVRPLGPLFSPGRPPSSVARPRAPRGSLAASPPSSLPSPPPAMPAKVAGGTIVPGGDELDHAVAFLKTRDGLDKALKLMRYASMIGSLHALRLDPRSVAGEKLRRLEGEHRADAQVPAAREISGKRPTAPRVGARARVARVAALGHRRAERREDRGRRPRARGPAPQPPRDRVPGRAARVLLRRAVHVREQGGPRARPKVQIPRRDARQLVRDAHPTPSACSSRGSRSGTPRPSTTPRRRRCERTSTATARRSRARRRIARAAAAAVMAATSRNPTTIPSRRTAGRRRPGRRRPGISRRRRISRVGAR